MNQDTAIKKIELQSKKMMEMVIEEIEKTAKEMAKTGESGGQIVNVVASIMLGTSMEICARTVDYLNNVVPEKGIDHAKKFVIDAMKLAEETIDKCSYVS